MHILLNRGAMCDIATRMSRSMSILLRCFDLITAAAEKPALHKYDVTKGTRTRRALQPTSGNSDQAFERSTLRGIWIINKRISYSIVLLHVFRKIFLKMRN